MRKGEGVQIALTQGYIAIVDAADFEWLSERKWFVRVDRCSVYARTWDGEARRSIYMHRLILGLPDDHVDHINGDGLDNRRSNLRVCTLAQNRQNVGPRSGRKYKGTSKKGNRWGAEIRAHGGRQFLGSFSTQEEAARAYDAAAKRLHGEFAWLNFPEEAA